MKRRNVEKAKADYAAAMFVAGSANLTIPPGAIFPRMIDWSSCHAVEQDPDRYSGAWVFRGTRVPVAALFENLEDDVPAHQFVE